MGEGCMKACESELFVSLEREREIEREFVCVCVLCLMVN